MDAQAIKSVEEVIDKAEQVIETAEQVIEKAEQVFETVSVDVKKVSGLLAKLLACFKSPEPAI